MNANDRWLGVANGIAHRFLSDVQEIRLSRGRQALYRADVRRRSAYSAF
jgi:hypothetical protein